MPKRTKLIIGAGAVIALIGTVAVLLKKRRTKPGRDTSDNNEANEYKEYIITSQGQKTLKRYDLKRIKNKARKVSGAIAFTLVLSLLSQIGTEDTILMTEAANNEIQTESEDSPEQTPDILQAKNLPEAAPAVTQPVEVAVEAPLVEASKTTSAHQDISPVVISKNRPVSEPEDTDESQSEEEPDKPTYTKLLTTALLPLGKTMYVWGGGWDPNTAAAAIEARTIGVNPGWEQFYLEQDKDYNFSAVPMNSNTGLDCSGYMGWVIYNTLESESGLSKNYVTGSTNMTRELSEIKHLGSVTEIDKSTAYMPGDIVSMEGHVWLSLGTCSDGSILLIHSAPPGVRLSGVARDGAENSKASNLAKLITQFYYPEWNERYPSYTVGPHYLTGSLFRWNNEILSDPDNVKQMTAEETVKLLYPEILIPKIK